MEQTKLFKVKDTTGRGYSTGLITAEQVIEGWNEQSWKEDDEDEETALESWLARAEDGDTYEELRTCRIICIEQ